MQAGFIEGMALQGPCLLVTSRLDHLPKSHEIARQVGAEVLLAMLVACFDASGHESNQPALVVAGFISSKDDWGIFEKEWTDRLRQDGIEYFHMVEFAHYWSAKSIFNGWDEPKRKSLIADLLKIIKSNSYRKFGTAVVVESFQRGIDPSLRQEFDLNAYALAGRTCATEVSKWAKMEQINSEIAFVFERGDLGAGKLIERFRNDGYPSPEFKTKQFAPLQAADILAYEMLKAIKDDPSGQPQDPLRWPMKELDRMHGELRMYRPRDIKQFNESLRLSRDLIQWSETNLSD